MRLLEAYQTKFAKNGAIGFDAWYDRHTKKCPSHNEKLE
jgi:hypothetical protein